MWVRSQLQEKNWEKWSDDYQADQMPKSQPEPAGLREKVANLQAQGVQVGVANIRGEVIVNLPDRGMTAGEFMTTPNEDLVPKPDPEATVKAMSSIHETIARLKAMNFQRQ
jgi:L-2-hydroxyglutarate oxidase LhgO